MTFVLDLGRHTVVRASGSQHGAMVLDTDRYRYRFADKAGHKVTINRFDGRMIFEHPRVGSTDRNSPRAAERWQCKRDKVGQML